MANEISIVVSSQDKTGPGFASAAAGQKKVIDATKATGKAYEQAQQKATGFGASLKRIGEVAAGVLVADVLQSAARRAQAFMHQAVEAASALGESINAVNKVFDASSEKVQAWGRENANQIGLSTRAFNQMATPLGSMLKNQGLSLDEVTDHTIKLTQRAADMASVFNTDVTDALVAIQAGLRGEQDPLERYGVSLSAVSVEARALADSHKTSTAQLTAQEKALARLNLIYEQTADTAGDFRDTADGLANAQRIATATMEDAKAKIGAAFIPIMAKAAELTAAFAEHISRVPQPTLLVTASVVGLGVAMLLLAPRILAVRTAINEMVVSESLAQRTMGKTALLAGKVGAALVVAQLAGTALAAVLKSDLNPQIEQSTKEFEKWDGQAELAGESARLFGESSEKIIDALKRATHEDTGFDKFMAGVGQALGGTEEQFAQGADRVKAFDDTLAGLVASGHAEDAAQILQEVASATGVSVEQILAVLPAYSGALKGAGSSTTDLGDATGTALEQIKAFRTEIDKFIGGPLALEEAEDKAAEAVVRLREQIKQQKTDHEAGAGALAGNTQAARDNREAMRDLVEMYGGLIEKEQSAGHSTEGLVTDLENQLVKMGLSRAEVERYIGQLKNLTAAIAAIPTAKTVTIKVKATGGAAYRVEGATGDLLGGMAHGGVVGAGSSWPGMAVASAASGGARGGWTMVGEHGRELARLPFGSTVIPHGTTEEMLSGGRGGAQPLVINLHGVGDEGQRVIELIRTEVAARGGTLAVLGLRS